MSTLTAQRITRFASISSRKTILVMIVTSIPVAIRRACEAKNSISKFLMAAGAAGLDLRANRAPPTGPVIPADRTAVEKIGHVHEQIFHGCSVVLRIGFQ